MHAPYFEDKHGSSASFPPSHFRVIFCKKIPLSHHVGLCSLHGWVYVFQTNPTACCNSTCSVCECKFQLSSAVHGVTLWKPTEQTTVYFHCLTLESWYTNLEKHLSTDVSNDQHLTNDIIHNIIKTDKWTSDQLCFTNSRWISNRLE